MIARFFGRVGLFIFAFAMLSKRGRDNHHSEDQGIY